MADGQVPRHLPASLQQTLCPLTRAQGPTASPLCPCGPELLPHCGSLLWGYASLPSPSNLEVQFVESGRQVLGHMAQEVAGQDEDLDIARTIEHVVRQPSVRQLVVVQVHRPGGQGTVLTHPGSPSPSPSPPGEPPNFVQVGPGAQDTLFASAEPQIPPAQVPPYSEGDQGSSYTAEGTKLVAELGFLDSPICAPPYPSRFSATPRLSQPWRPCLSTPHSWLCGTF